MRRLLEALAREQPLVVVFDDINWGEPTFLDLVEHVAEWTRDAPLLLVCMARPELHDCGLLGRRQAQRDLDLPRAAHRRRDRPPVRNLLGSGALEGALRRIRRARRAETRSSSRSSSRCCSRRDCSRSTTASGRRPEGLRELPVPASIQVLLASRLDLLAARSARCSSAPPSRASASAGAPSSTSPTSRPAQVGGSLQALVRKELVRQTGDDEFRFRHLLIRDAAYDSMPKQVRGVLHERFAEWAASRSGDEAELDEILGHHLEQAHAYRVALGPAGPRRRRWPPGRPSSSRWRGAGRWRGTTPASPRSC